MDLWISTLITPIANISFQMQHIFLVTYQKCCPGWHQKWTACDGNKWPKDCVWNIWDINLGPKQNIACCKSNKTSPKWSIHCCNCCFSWIHPALDNKKLFRSFKNLFERQRLPLMPWYTISDSTIVSQEPPPHHKQPSHWHFCIAKYHSAFLLANARSNINGWN